MLDETELRNKSHDELLQLIEQERVRAAEELKQLQRSTQRLIGEGQDMITHPLSTLNEIVEPGEIVRRSPWQSLGVALVAGFASAMIARRALSGDTAASSNVRRSPVGSLTNALPPHLRSTVRRELDQFMTAVVTGFFGQLRRTVEGGANGSTWRTQHRVNDQHAASGDYQPLR